MGLHYGCRKAMIINARTADRIYRRNAEIMDIVSLTIEALSNGDWAVYNSWPIIQQAYDATLGNVNWDNVGA